jgi:hypothetical protein
MNSIGNNLFNNSLAPSISNNSASVLNGAASPWFLIGGIILLLVLAYMLYQRQTIDIHVELPEVPESPEMKQRVSNNGRLGENWCFVGEDATGRWCVKVPQPDACSPERLFSSRPACELVTASPLPLGLLSKGGAEMHPLLAALHTK